jgi:hypothetical protein
MKRNLWRELKDIEIETTDLLASGIIPKRRAVTRLRNLFAQCSLAPDANDAICYHGSKAILAQLDGDIEIAIKHRETEARMINRLYELEEENPTDGWTLQNFQDDDIRKRTQILAQLRKIRTEQDGSGQPATRPESK